MASAPRLVQLRCPRCGQSHWVIDYDWRGGGLVEKPELGYPERDYDCPHCTVTGNNFKVLQKSPASFLWEPCDLYPMSSQVFDYWMHILSKSGLFRVDGEFTYKSAFPREPTLRQLIEAALPILSFLGKVQNKKRAIFGDDLKEIDWPCLNLVFEYHLCREVELDPASSRRRLEDYLSGQDMDILSEDTVVKILPGLWAHFLLVFEKLVEEINIYHDLDQHPIFGYDRCVSSAVLLFSDTYLRESLPSTIIQSAKWKYVSSQVIDSRLKHRMNPPLRTLLEREPR